jgi:tRNA-2-methylthio-N6-dimethylallyladenosine synthase
MLDTKPKYHLLTFGCQMNKNDSERMEALLHGLGFVSTDMPAEADLILINTCSVRQQAEDSFLVLQVAWRGGIAMV